MMEEKMINYGNRTNMRKRRRRYNRKRIALLLLFLLLVIVLVSWGVVSLFAKPKKPVEKKIEEIDQSVVVPEVVEKKPWEDMTEDQTVSILSALPVSKTEAAKRPVAIMINNAYEALPQSGISKAEIMYEVPVEGELVRLMGVFQDIDIDKIGPVRSARHYFLDYAFDNDAIYVHYGTSPLSDKYIKEWNSPSLNGLNSTGSSIFDVDSTRQKPHNVFANGEKLLNAWTKKYVKTREEGKQVQMLKFGASDETKYDDEAKKVLIDYSYYQKSEFRYNEKEGVYDRYQTVRDNEMRQVDSMGTLDESDDTPLKYKNVIIQYTDVSRLMVNGVADAEGRKEIKTIGSGEGIYITNGTSTPIKWSKTGHYEPTKYTDLAGKEIEFNRGKTWICIVPTTITAKISKDEVIQEAGKIDMMPSSIKMVD